MVRIRPLTPSDASTITGLATLHAVASLHPEEAKDRDRRYLLRRFGRRYRLDITRGTAGECAFVNDEVVAFALHMDVRNPLSADRERHLVDLFVSGAAGVAALPELLSCISASSRRHGIDVIRCELEATAPSATEIDKALTGAGYLRHHLVVRKSLSPVEIPAGAFATTTSEYERFAHECLRRSVERGQLAMGSQIDPATLDRYVGRRFKVLNGRNRRSYVALGTDGEPRAHALFELVSSRLCSSREALLVDIHVPPAWVGEGWGARLTAYAENELFATGFRHAEASLFQVNVSNWEVVLSSAQRRGWFPSRQSFVQLLTRDLRNIASLAYQEIQW
jgi:hypothetical protein